MEEVLWDYVWTHSKLIDSGFTSKVECCPHQNVSGLSALSGLTFVVRAHGAC